MVLRRFFSLESYHLIPSMSVLEIQQSGIGTFNLKKERYLNDIQGINFIKQLIKSSCNFKQEQKYLILAWNLLPQRWVRISSPKYQKFCLCLKWSEIKGISATWAHRAGVCWGLYLEKKQVLSKWDMNILAWKSDFIW